MFIGSGWRKKGKQCKTKQKWLYLLENGEIQANDPGRLDLNAIYFSWSGIWKQAVKHSSHSCILKSLPAIFLMSKFQKGIYWVNKDLVFQEFTNCLKAVLWKFFFSLLKCFFFFRFSIFPPGAFQASCMREIIITITVVLRKIEKVQCYNYNLIIYRGKKLHFLYNKLMQLFYSSMQSHSSLLYYCLVYYLSIGEKYKSDY